MNTEPMPKCPQCGATLPPNAPAGLCPNCLMALNFKTETAFSGEQTAAQAPLPPDQIAPHFPQLEILECLGRGGMGVVYKARQKMLNRFVALKLLAPERVNDPKFAGRFAREAQALAALNHPNIVTIHDFGQAGGFYYLLMEFVDGTNLRHLLRDRKFMPEEALAIVPPLCDALQFAHERGIVHRDIKPENILLDKTGRVKVADFGIAKMLGGNEPLTPSLSPSDGARVAKPGDGLSLTGEQAVGTPGYSAPEQQSDPKRVDSRADIYSLGVVFYEMLTGELPGKKIEPPSNKVHIDVRLDEIVLRALEKKPELRYQQASVLKTQVETIATTRGAPDSAGTNQPRTVPFRYHSPRRFRDRWLWDYHVIALVASILMVVPTVLVLSLLPILGNQAHWFWLFYVLPLGYIAVYEAVARRMRQLRERAYPQAQEMAEVLLVHLPVQTPAIALLTAENLELIGIAGPPLIIPRADIESIEQIRWFNGRRLWWKMGLRIRRRSTTPVLLAIAEPVGERWTKILKGEETDALRAQAETIAVTSGTGAGRTERGWVAPESGWGWLVGRMFGITFTSRSAFQLANLSAVGFLGLAGFLGHTPGLEWCLRLFGLFGLFGLVGFAFLAEFIARLAAAAPTGAAPSAKPDVGLLGAIYTAVFLLLVAWGNAVAMMIVSGLALVVGLIWFAGGKQRMMLLVMLAACGIASGVAMLVNQSLHHRPAMQLPVGQAQCAISRVSVDGNKVVIEGTATTGARLAFYADRRSNGWSCGFNYPDQFTATLEQGLTGLSCRVQPRLGKPVFTMGSGKYIGDVNLSDGKLVFRAGQPRQESDGVWSVTIGEFTAKSGKKVTVGILLLPPRAEDLLPAKITQEGWQLWQVGKLAEAAEKFHQAIRLAPGDANAWNGLGWAQFNDGDTTLTEQSFQVAIGVEPNQSGALNGLGQVYLSQRKFADSEKYLLRAAPEASAAWFGLARLYLLQGKFEQAEIWARKIVDSGQADEMTLKLLEAARQRKLGDELRHKIEPQPARPASQVTPEAGAP